MDAPPPGYRSTKGSIGEKQPLRER